MGGYSLAAESTPPSPVSAEINRGNRLIVGTLDPKFPNSTNEAELVQDRIVRFTLVTTGGR
jgi:hypothetical protein